MSKKREKKNKLKLFHNATIAMSLMSWYTTFNGFKDSVFANGQGLVAGLSSMAIQVILLGGILNIVPITKEMNNMKKKKTETRKKACVYFWFAFKIFCIWSIFILAMVTSITFSYISIANNIYATDYAVNANIKMDGFMRTTIQGMEADNREYLDGMRERLIKKLKENGEDIIEKSAEKRGSDYAKSTAKLPKMVETAELITLDKTIEKFSKKKLLKSDDIKYFYHSIKKTYTDLLYDKFMKSEGQRDKHLQDTQFTAGMQKKINNLNRDKLAIYSEYHYQYSFAVDKYNEWIEILETGGDVPSLEQMQVLAEFCTRIQKGLKKLGKAIEAMEDGFAHDNTLRLISEAKLNMDSLVLEADNIKNKVDMLIKYTYFGTDSLSFEQLISAFGSSETTLETLDQARKQLLEMQGVFLAGEYNKSGTGENQSEEEKISKVTSLMHDIEKYIEAVRYDKNLKLLKQKISKNYNVVKYIEKSDYESMKTAQPNSVSKSAVSESPQNESMKTAQPNSVSESAVSESPQNKSVSEAALYAEMEEDDDDNDQEKNDKKPDEIEDNEKNSVVSVTSEEWTNEKKKQMAELEGMIFSHPVNLYCPEAYKGKIKDQITQDGNKNGVTEINNWQSESQKELETEKDFWENKSSKNDEDEIKNYEKFCWTTYYKYKADAVEHRKLYLDTSEMEKAYNLLAGAPKYFPYKGKALIALVFAVFLDFGAFLLGVVMFFSKKGKQKKESRH